MSRQFLQHHFDRSTQSAHVCVCVCMCIKREIKDGSTNQEALVLRQVLSMTSSCVPSVIRPGIRITFLSLLKRKGQSVHLVETLIATRILLLGRRSLLNS